MMPAQDQRCDRHLAAGGQRVDDHVVAGWHQRNPPARRASSHDGVVCVDSLPFIIGIITAPIADTSAPGEPDTPPNSVQASTLFMPSARTRGR